MNPAAKALWQHYRRQPLQFFLLLAGIVIGIVMVNGVALLNQQAYQSYRDGEQLMGMRAAAFIEPKQARGSLPQLLYVALRNQGFNALTPVVSGTLVDASGRRLSIVGTDPLAFTDPNRLTQAGRGSGSLADFILPPYRVRVSTQRAQQLGLTEGELLLLQNGERLAAISLVSRAGLGHRLWLDIGYAQQLLDMNNRISYIAIMDESQAQQLAARLPDEVKLRFAQDEFSLNEMTRSLHLNLMAMGLLAWVVGVFIVYNAVAFSYQDRARLFGQLQIAGVSRVRLQQLLSIELMLFAIFAIVIATPLSVWLSQGLLPVLGRTLDNLYGVTMTYQTSWQLSAVIRAALVAIAGILLAAGWPLYQIGRSHPLDGVQKQQQAFQSKQRLNGLALIGAMLLSLALLLALLLPGLRSGFVVLALLLLGNAFCLPWLISWLLAWLASKIPSSLAVLRWSVTELNWQMTQNGIATIALVLALTANVGLNTMVGSFRDTVTDWLSQRLYADLYIRPDHQAADLRRWLEEHPRVDKIFTQKSVEVAVRNTEAQPADPPSQTIEVMNMDNDPQVHQALTMRFLVKDGWQAFIRGEGGFVSEREYLLNRRLPGSEIILGADRTPLRVLGVYYDYGNPQGQLMLDSHLFEQIFPDIEPAGIGLTLQAGIEPADLWQQLANVHGLSDAQVIDQQQIKQIALSVFEQTFAVTRVLNILTLGVAALGLMCALLLLGERRRKGYAILTSIGVSSQKLFRTSLLQWGCVGLLVAMLSLPFGIVLAWVLIHLLNVYGFGWSYPLVLQPLSYLNLMLLSVAVTLFAALVPQIRQRSRSLARQLSQEW